MHCQWLECYGWIYLFPTLNLQKDINSLDVIIGLLSECHMILSSGQWLLSPFANMIVDHGSMWYPKTMPKSLTPITWVHEFVSSRPQRWVKGSADVFTWPFGHWSCSMPKASEDLDKFDGVFTAVWESPQRFVLIGSIHWGAFSKSPSMSKATPVWNPPSPIAQMVSDEKQMSWQK